MDGREFDELVSRWNSGDRLAPAEEQRLLDWLTTHPEAQRELLADESLDSLLHSSSRLDETADDFVRDCLGRTADQVSAGQLEPVLVAAPPIIVPPVTVLAPPKAAGGTPWQRRLFSATRRRWAVAAIACSAAVLMAAIGWHWLSPVHRPVETNPAAPLFAAKHEPRPVPKGAFATLAESSSAAWETPLATGDRLAAGWLKLTSGTAELRFDKGSLARLTGPADFELRSVDEVFLRAGCLTAHVPPPAVGFAVVTPLSRIVDLGTEFDVVVEDSGATQTLVHKGRVSLRPPKGREESSTPIELAAGALDHATVSVPNIQAAILPVTTIAYGEGHFLGRVSADGKTAEFHSRAAFREFRAVAMKQFREAPGQFGQKWPALAEGAGKAIGEGIKPISEAASPRSDIAGGQTVEVQEGGKTISITDSKESGITVTVTESVGEKKKTTKVRAADPADLLKKNPDAHQLYRKYFHPKPKAGKVK